MCGECQPNKDHKLLSQMDFDDNQQLNVRIVSSLSVGTFSVSQVRICLYCCYCWSYCIQARYELQKFWLL